MPFIKKIHALFKTVIPAQAGIPLEKFSVWSAPDPYQKTKLGADVELLARDEYQYVPICVFFLSSADSIKSKKEEECYFVNVGTVYLQNGYEQHARTRGGVTEFVVINH